MKILKTLMIAGLLALSATAFAHTGIKSTFPANEQILDATPEQLTLTFKGNVRLMKVILVDSKLEEHETAFKPSAKAGKSFVVELETLAAGEYTVNWVSMGKDGHKIKGDFSFTINNE